MHCYDMTPLEAVDYNYNDDVPSPYQSIKTRLFDGKVPRGMLFIMQERRFNEDTLTGNLNYDMQLSARLVPARLTIEHMLNVYESGERVVIPDEDDRVTIYKIISTHLRCCMIHNGDLYRGNPVSVMTMTLMEDFLDDLYPTAKHSIVKSAAPAAGAIERFNNAVGVIRQEKERNVADTRNRIFNDDIIEEMLSEENGDNAFDEGFGGELWE